MVCHHPDKSYDHRHCDSRGIIFSISHVTSREHKFKGLCDFSGESPIQIATTLPCLLASGDIEYSKCNVTSQNPLIEGSCSFKSGSSSWYVSTMPSLPAIGVMIVEI